MGRLIGVSATICLALLRRENLPLAIVTDAIVIGGLWSLMGIRGELDSTTRGLDDGES